MKRRPSPLVRVTGAAKTQSDAAAKRYLRTIAGKKGLDPSNAAARVLGQVMLPDAKYPPAMPAQRPGDKAIPCGVGRELLFPERTVVYRHV